MFREAIIKLGGATLLLLGIGFLIVGFLVANKLLQATGFISCIISIVLLYYARAVENRRRLEEERKETMLPAKQ